MLVEVCCNSFESALNAEQAGADRIELCSELGVGGITPSYGLIQQVKEQLSIPIRVLIRPRSGHFSYTDYELSVMVNDINMCKILKVAGVVSGSLKEDHALNEKHIEVLKEAAGEMKFTFHRAFDWLSNQSVAIQQLEKLGIDCILSSGKEVSAEKGIEQLKTLQQKTNTITLMPGGGVNPENATKFKDAGFKMIHLSGTSFKNKISMVKKISMNSHKHLLEHQVAVTNEDIIRQIVEIVK